MHVSRRLFRIVPGAMLIAPAMALASGALAQSTADFRLQPGSRPPAQGPVDPDNPAAPPTAPAQTSPAAGPTATSSPAPAPVPAPTPTIAIPPPAATPPAPSAASAARPAAGAPTRPAANAAMPPAAPTGPAPLAAAPPGPVLPSPPTGLPPALPAAKTAPVPAGIPAWWWLLPAGLAGTIAAWAFLARARGRARAESAPEFVRPRPAGSGEAPPRPMPQPAPQPSSATAAPLQLMLEPLRFTVTLVNASLQYRLTLVNHSAAPLGPVLVAADMIAAHASLSDASQLGQDGTGLELRHEVAAIRPGERVELSGELRLPLAQATPIRAGGASLLVPLVRLRVEGAGPMRTTALVVGEPPASPGGPLRPFRLDQGPRLFGAVSQRSLAAAA